MIVVLFKVLKGVKNNEIAAFLFILFITRDEAFSKLMTITEVVNQLV